MELAETPGKKSGRRRSLASPNLRADSSGADIPSYQTEAGSPFRLPGDRAGGRGKEHHTPLPDRSTDSIGKRWDGEEWPAETQAAKMADPYVLPDQSCAPMARTSSQTNQGTGWGKECPKEISSQTPRGDHSRLSEEQLVEQTGWAQEEECPSHTSPGRTPC